MIFKSYLSKINKTDSAVLTGRKILLGVFLETVALPITILSFLVGFTYKSIKGENKC